MDSPEAEKADSELSTPWEMIQGHREPPRQKMITYRKPISTAKKICTRFSAKPMPLPPALPAQAAHVYLTGGGLAGQVADLLISSDSMRVVALEVCAGPWYRLLGQSSYAREYQVRQRTGQVLVGQLFSWAQMEQMLKEEGE